MAIECEHGSLARSCLICELQERIRELDRQLADCAIQSSSRQGLLMQYEARMESLERQLSEEVKRRITAYQSALQEIGELSQQIAEARAERDRALDGLARVHEQYLKEAK